MASFMDKLSHAWNAFRDTPEPERPAGLDFAATYAARPDRPRIGNVTDKSIVTSIYNRMAIDVASVTIKHVRLDNNARYSATIPSGLNECLNTEANLDQAARAFRQDMAMTLFDKGSIAIVPVETSGDPMLSDSYDIKTLRVGQIVAWYPEAVRVSVWDEKSGKRRELTLPKRIVAIVENPLFAVMNEPSSTLQRLTRKLTILDAIDEQSGSGKLDLIIQLPYQLKSEIRREQAEVRRKDIEMQLTGSKYGIAYTDSTEKVIQLNRSTENNLLGQIEFLTTMLYGQLGITPEVMNGTADEKTMLNYHNRAIEPIVAAITEAIKRTFLTKTARSQGQSIEFYRDPFKLVAVADIAKIADTFTRNEILTANEVRGIIGFQPAPDARADELVNKNLPTAIEQAPSTQAAPQPDPIELRQITP